MPLDKVAKSRERIMATGAEKSGKSSAWLSIARLAQLSGSDAQFRVVESDDSWQRLYETEYPELTNVTSQLVLSWPDYPSVTKKFIEASKPGDWIICDLHNTAWEAVQTWYQQEIYGDDPETYFTEIRKALGDPKKAAPEVTENSIDWIYVNKIYKAWAQDFFYRNPAHIFLCSAAHKIDSREKNEEVKNLFGGLGMKPAGQKDTLYHVQSILYFSKAKKGADYLYRVTTVGDRGREPLKGAEITNEVGSDFASTYLLGPGKWTAPELDTKEAKLAAAKARAKRGRE